MITSILGGLSIILLVVSLVILIVYNVIVIVKKCIDTIKFVKIGIKKIKEEKKNDKKFRHEKVTLQNLLLKCKKYFSNNTNEKLLNIIGGLVIISVCKGDYLIKIFPKRIDMVYIMGVIFAVVNFMIGFIKALLERTRGFDRIANVIVLVFVLFFMGMVSIYTLLEDIAKSEINFVVIIGFIGIMMPCILSFVRCFLQSSSKNLIEIILGVVSFYIFEIYVALLFGIYNLSTNPSLQVYLDLESPWKMIARMIHFGYMYMLSLPALDYRLTYFLEFLIGNIIHVIILGLIISYASSLVKNDSNKENMCSENKDLKDNEVLQEVSATNEVALSNKLEKRIRILNAIHSFKINHGDNPCILDLKNETKIKSLQSIYFHVKKLEEEDYICIGRNTANISTTKKGIELLKMKQCI